MRTLKVVLADLKAAESEAQALVALAKKDGRELTAEEVEKVNAAMDKADALRAEGDQARKDRAVSRSAAGRVATLSRDLDDAPEAPDSATDTSTDLGRPAITYVKDRIESDPARGYKTPRAFLLDVVAACTPGRQSEVRNPDGLRLLATAGADEQSTVSDQYGNYLLPAAFSPNLLTTASEGDPTMGRVQEIPMSVPSLDIAARTDKNHSTSVSGGLRVYRTEKTDTVSSSRASFERVGLRTTTLMGITYGHETLLRYSPVSFVALLERGFRDEIASEILNEKLNGTGAGEMTGVLNAPCTISVSKETGQAAASIVWSNILKMRARCWRYGDCIWIANHDTIPQLATMYLATGTGGVPVFMPNGGSIDNPSTLYGRPIFFSEYAKTVGTVGDIIVGCWSEYLVGTLEGPEFAESIHVRFEYNERTFRVTVENDGAPWWRSALTPRNGSTLSPFVTLATRA